MKELEIWLEKMEGLMKKIDCLEPGVFLVLVFMSLPLLTGCGSSSESYDVSGGWEGAWTNNETNLTGGLRLDLVMHSDGSLTGFLTDLAINTTVPIHSGSFSDKTIQFTLSDSSITIIFSGTLHDKNNMAGTWTASGARRDGGTWRVSRISSDIVEEIIIDPDQYDLEQILNTEPPYKLEIESIITPTSFSAIPKKDAVELAWSSTASLDVAKYRIYVSTGSESFPEVEKLDFVLLAELDPETHRYTHAGLTPGVKYYYAITTVNEKGSESGSNTQIAWAVPGTGEYGELDRIYWSE